MSRGKYLAPVLLLLTTVACRRDMQQQPKYTPLSRSWFFADGRSARPTPPGAIATDEVTIDPAHDTGSVNGQFVTTIPIPVTAQLLARGRNRFNIYCAPCHSPTGYGNGMIWTRGFEAPANLNGDRVRNAPPGYMIGNTSDRWAIVAYIRALELSQHATLNDVPAKDRAILEAQP